ncbi:MFS transporter [Peribacillus sp. V2I11]|uniref:MFS transporter n=1 Tax=Peribacillus sp. V2I11 TaxID=3042277 RepID=UPI00278904CB|nr:MFS transporter [Peribacillus sp. V2I11]MDQ0884463.1 ACS family hexuronate transporter-like MFS transporter [Peribacillus sp. V2I11]
MRWITLGFLFLLFTINYADKSIAGFAAVKISEEFGISPVQWGLVGSSFFVSFVIASVFGSSLVGLFGTKKMLAFMALTWSILQLGAFTITSFPMLIAYRILLGVFEGPFFAVVITHLYKWFPPESRGKATAILNFGGPFGSLVCAPALVYMIQHYGWKTSFASLGILSLVWLIFWVWLGKEHPENSAEEINIVKEKTPVKQKVRFSEISLALVSRIFILTTIVAFTAYWLVSWVQVWMPSYLTQALKVSPTQMGYISAIIGIGAGLVTISVSSLSDYLYKKSSSYKKSHVMVIGVSVITGAILFYSITEVHYIAWVTFVLFVVKGLFSSVHALGPAIISRLAPDRTSLMIGIYTSLQTMAGVIAPIVSGSLIQKAGSDIVLGYNYSVLMIVALGVVFSSLFLFIVNPDKLNKKKTTSLENESENVVV